MRKVRVTAVNGRKIQADGKWLTTIGNRAVSIGDLVWTDGKCVYGHHSMSGGAGVIADSAADTIPLLLSGSQYAIFCKGQYTLLGSGESHSSMVNNKSKYAFVEMADILDADIDGAGNIYTLHPGKYEYKTNIGYHLKNYDIRKYSGEINFTGTHYPNTDLTGNIDIIPWNVPEYRECYDCEIPGGGTPTEENTPAEVRFNGVAVTQINLRDVLPSIDDLESDAFRYAEEKEYLMAQEGSREWPPGRPCPEKSLHSRTIHALGGKVDSQGNWSLIVEEAVNVTFFPWLSYRNPEWSAEVHHTWGGHINEPHLARRDIHTETVSIVGGTVKSWFKGTATVKTYYLVTPNGITRLADERKATVDYVRGVLFMQITDGVGKRNEFPDDMLAPGGHEGEWLPNWSYGYITLGDCLKVWAYIDMLPHYNHYWWGTSEGWLTGCEDTFRYTIGWNTHIEYYSDFKIFGYCRVINMDITPRQDGTFTKEKTVEKDVQIPLSDGFYGILDEEGENIAIYTSSGTQIVSIPWTFESNISCCHDGKGIYLVGIHGKELLACSAEGQSTLSKKLCNFRLRKLKNIKKWQKEATDKAKL